MHSSAEELVDVIDEAGHTVGVVSRGEMRSRRLPHRCTYVFIFNQRGEIFIHLRTPTKDVYASHWDVAIGGVLGPGETFAAGAQREVREEVGLEIPLTELFPFRYADERTIVQAMVYKAVHDGPFQLQAEEIVRDEFVSLAEVKERSEREPFCPDGLAALAEYQRRARCITEPRT
jgi:isopentenyldiphosphate isomerase